MAATDAIDSTERTDFTRLNRPLRILARATMPIRSAALRAEYAFKQASRADKLQWCAAGLERFVAKDCG